MPAACVSVSLALLFAGLVSVASAPAVTVAAFVSAPVVFGSTAPLIVTVSWLPAPGSSVAFVHATAFPAVVLLPQLPTPVTTQVVATPVIPAGTVSATVKPLAVAGPALVTTSAEVIGAPGT